MPSVSKPQATLMAMAFAKKKKIPQRGARDFNRADKGSGMLKKSGGGPAGMMGHALSGTQLGQADSLIRKAQDSFARFADGGAVKKPQPKGPSLKERKEIRAIVDRGKTDAVSALRATRASLMETVPEPAEDADVALAKLSTRLAMKDGDGVEEDEEPETAIGDPGLMYQEYAELLETLQDAELDEGMREEIVDRLADIEHALSTVGIEAGDAPAGE
jgi:hypothetical protein